MKPAFSVCVCDRGMQSELVVGNSLLIFHNIQIHFEENSLSTITNQFRQHYVSAVYMYITLPTS